MRPIKKGTDMFKGYKQHQHPPTVYYCFFKLFRAILRHGVCCFGVEKPDRQYVLPSVHMYAAHGVCAAYMCTLGSTYHRFPFGT